MKNTLKNNDLEGIIGPQDPRPMYVEVQMGIRFSEDDVSTDGEMVSLKIKQALKAQGNSTK